MQPYQKFFLIFLILQTTTLLSLTITNNSSKKIHFNIFKEKTIIRKAYGKLAPQETFSKDLDKDSKYIVNIYDPLNATRNKRRTVLGDATINYLDKKRTK